MRISGMTLLALLLISAPARADVQANINEVDGWHTFTISCTYEEDCTITHDAGTGQALVNGVPPFGFRYDDFEVTSALAGMRKGKVLTNSYPR